VSTDPPVESPPSHGNDVGRTFGSKSTGRCFLHRNRRAITLLNGNEVCRECLQVCLDVYHEIALRGFDA